MYYVLCLWTWYFMFPMLFTAHKLSLILWTIFHQSDISLLFTAQMSFFEDTMNGQGHLISRGIIRAWSPVHCVTWWCMRGWPLAHGELPPHSHDLVTRGFLKQRHRVNYDHEGWEGESGDQWITDHKGQLMGPGAHIESVIVNLRASVRASVSPST